MLGNVADKAKCTVYTSTVQTYVINLNFDFISFLNLQNFNIDF